MILLNIMLAILITLNVILIAANWQIIEKSNVKKYKLDEKDVRTLYMLLQEMLAEETIRRALVKHNGNYQDTLRYLLG